MAEPAQDLAPGTMLGGRFQVVQKLGEGSFSSVYRALDQSLSVECAVKVLHQWASTDSELLERFKREVLYSRRIVHEGCAQVFDFSDQSQLAFLVMELVPGWTVDELISRLGRLELPVASSLAAQSAVSVAVLHRNDIIHRDLKSENMMVTPTGRLKVLDLGMSWSAELSTLTAVGSLIGTPAYMAPELILGNAPTSQTDVYALGVLFHLLMTGELPFQAPDLAKLLAMHVQGKPRPARELRPEVPEAVEILILECLRKEPQLRPKDAQVLEKRWEQVLGAPIDRAAVRQAVAALGTPSAGQPIGPLETIHIPEPQPAKMSEDVLNSKHTGADFASLVLSALQQSPLPAKAESTQTLGIASDQHRAEPTQAIDLTLDPPPLHERTQPVEAVPTQVPVYERTQPLELPTEPPPPRERTQILELPTEPPPPRERTQILELPTGPPDPRTLERTDELPLPRPAGESFNEPTEALDAALIASSLAPRPDAPPPDRPPAAQDPPPATADRAPGIAEKLPSAWRSGGDRPGGARPQLPLPEARPRGPKQESDSTQIVDIDVKSLSSAPMPAGPDKAPAQPWPQASERAAQPSAAPAASRPEKSPAPAAALRAVKPPAVPLISPSGITPMPGSLPPPGSLPGESDATARLAPISRSASPLRNLQVPPVPSVPLAPPAAVPEPPAEVHDDSITQEAGYDDHEPRRRSVVILLVVLAVVCAAAAAVLLVILMKRPALLRSIQQLLSGL